MFIHGDLRVSKRVKAAINHRAKMNGQLEFVISHGPNALIAVTKNICQLQIKLSNGTYGVKNQKNIEIGISP